MTKREFMGTFEAYLRLIDKKPLGFLWRDIAEVLDVDSSVQGSRIGNYVTRMLKWGLVKKVGKTYIPLFFKCEGGCRLFKTRKKQLIEELECLKNVRE